MIWLGSSLALVWFTDAYKLVVVERILPELLLAMAAATALAIGVVRWPSPALPCSCCRQPRTGLRHAADLWPEIDLEPDDELRAATLASLASLLHVDGKILPKVLNVTDDVDAFLPHNQSWLVPGRLRYLNFSGYEPHLAMDRAYFDMMGAWYGRFNREWFCGPGSISWSGTKPRAGSSTTHSRYRRRRAAGHLEARPVLEPITYREQPRSAKPSALLSYLETTRPPGAHRDGWLEGRRWTFRQNSRHSEPRWDHTQTTTRRDLRCFARYCRLIQGFSYSCFWRLQRNTDRRRTDRSPYSSIHCRRRRRSVAH